MMEMDRATGAYRDTGVVEMDRVTGGIYSEDPGVESLHHILYLISSHLIVQRITHSILTIFSFHSLFRRLRVDPGNCMDPHSRVVSYLLTLLLGSLSQNRSFSRILFGMP